MLDIEVEDRGPGVVTLWPLSAAGSEFLRTQARCPRSLWFGTALGADPRFLPELLTAARDAGLAVRPRQGGHATTRSRRAPVIADEKVTRRRRQPTPDQLRVIEAYRDSYGTAFGVEPAGLHWLERLQAFVLLP